MRVLRRFLSVLAAAATMVAAGGEVRADLYGTSYFSGAFDVRMRGNIDVSTRAGTFTTYLATDSSGTGATPYISYCIDLKHYTSPGNYKVLDDNPSQLPFTDEFVSGASNMIADTAWYRAGMGRAAWLANEFGNTVHTDAQRGLLQVAIWKVLYSGPGDTAAQYKDITLGSEYTTSLTAAQRAVVNGYLTASVLAGGGSTYAMGKAYWVNFKDVTGDHVQFQVIGVPEPSSLAIAGLGVLGLVGWTRRRPRLG